MAYERFIFESGEVPTRDGLHDFFNGLCWMQFPRTKKTLEPAAGGGDCGRRHPGGARPGSRRDHRVRRERRACCTRRTRCGTRWQRGSGTRLFGELRPLWRQAQLVLFGHAALEKLVAPYKSITAHVWRIAEPWNSMAQLDAWLAQDLTAAKLAAKPFVPLPVLGVPGWWPANEDPTFYADAGVFRPARHVPQSAQ